MIIYKITNKVNGKIYIGQTIHTLEDRWQQHLRNARNGVRTHFYHAIRKYGAENFEPEILCVAETKEELNALETYYIQEYDSISLGYNMVDGGNNNVMFIPEVKAKHSARLSTEKTRKNISEGMKKYREEHPFTKSHKEKLSRKAKGNTNGKNNPSHSIPCYCLDNGKRIDFKNYKEAGIWWYKTYHPFGEKYSQATYQRKIIDCIEKGYCKFRRKKYDFRISQQLYWYRKEGGVNE